MWRNFIGRVGARGHAAWIPAVPMKKTTPRLALARQTLRALTPHQLAASQGGQSDPGAPSGDPGRPTGGDPGLPASHHHCGPASPPAHG